MMKEICSIFSILHYLQPIYYECKNFCNNKYYTSIEYYQKSNSEKTKIDLEPLLAQNYAVEKPKNEDLLAIIAKGYLCLSNSGKNEKKTEPKYLRKCLRS